MKKKIVVVTGTTSGLGETLAKMYAKGGAIVVAQGRNEKKLSALKKWSDDYGYGLMDPLCLDLLEKNAAERFYQYVINKWNTIDIWINNAGFGYVGAYTACSLELIQEMSQVNIDFVNQASYLVANDMIRKHSGTIVNIASTGAYHPGPFTAQYYATKAYVASFTEALYYECKPHGVHVMSVCPGAMDTPFSRKAGRRDNAFAMSTQKVARAIIHGVEKKKSIVVPGVFYRMFIRIPRKIAAPLIEKQQKKLAFHIDN